MKDEARKWLQYADENLKSAEILLDNNLFNPCLQNVQQAVEKSLEAVLVELSVKFRKTHSINELMMLVTENAIDIDITDNDRDLLDSIYLPSKYPLGGILPEFEPNHEICQKCLIIAKNVRNSIKLD